MKAKAYEPKPDCDFCGGIHYGSRGCVYKCPDCGKDMREGHPHNDFGAVIRCGVVAPPTPIQEEK